eukprot:3005266-Rhodomonas_salina.2
MEHQIATVMGSAVVRLKAHQEADKVAPLRIVNGGDSIRIDCLTGAGVQELRDKASTHPCEEHMCGAGSQPAVDRRWKPD